MKKLILFISVMLFVSCSDKGEITTEPTDFIIIHGKTYKLMQVVPKYGYRSIWIMYPKDSTDQMPQTINYDVQQDKHSVTETVIKVD